MLEAVIFDMDGVIFDSEPIHVAHEQKIFRDLGLNLSEEEHNTYIGTTSYYMWELVKNRYNLPHTVEELVEIDRGGFYKILSKENDEVKLVCGIDKFIDKLYKKELKFAIASSSPIDVIKKVVEIFGLEEYFDVLVTGDAVAKSKPEPDIFLYAAKCLNVSPENCLVVEDSHNGVIAAKRAGMKCIGYLNPNSGNQDLSEADVIVDCYDKVDVDNIENFFSRR